MNLYFSKKPNMYYGVVTLLHANNRKAHSLKNCPALKRAKEIYTFKVKEDMDFDIIPCKICIKE